MSRLRIQWMPSGSSPFAGSSRSRVDGSPSSAVAMPSRWPMPSENLPARFRATSWSPTRSISSSTRFLRDAVCLREREQVVIGGAAGVDGPRLEQRADLVQRRLVVPVVLAVHDHVARGRRVEAEDQPHRRRLPGAVRAEETGDDPGPDGERQVVDGPLVAVVLRQAGGFDHTPRVRARCGGGAVLNERTTRFSSPGGFRHRADRGLQDPVGARAGEDEHDDLGHVLRGHHPGEDVGRAAAARPRGRSRWRRRRGRRSCSGRPARAARGRARA